jgi:hypothetical protein
MYVLHKGPSRRPRRYKSNKSRGLRKKAGTVIDTQQLFEYTLQFRLLLT